MAQAQALSRDQALSPPHPIIIITIIMDTIILRVLALALARVLALALARVLALVRVLVLALARVLALALALVPDLSEGAAVPNTDAAMTEKPQG
jgi:hypothetical protein